MSNSRRMPNRPSKDEYFMGLAMAVARRSTCLRRQVGAVIVDNRGRVAATGYNGAPTGMEHCSKIGCLRDRENILSGQQQQRCRAVHAEQNALIQAVGTGAQLEGGTIYTLISPCVICAKMILNTRLAKVVYLEDYPDEYATSLMKEGGLEIVHFPVTKAQLALGFTE